MRETLADLINKLQAAQKSVPDDGDTKARARVRKSLAAVMDYLRAEEVPIELRAPLQHLYAALEDVSEGRQSELLKPATMLPRTMKKPTFEASQWSTAAAAVTILKDDAGWKLSDALKAAAKPIGADWRALREFRKNIGKGRVPQIASENYSWMLNTFRKQRDFSPEERAGKLLGIASDLKEQKG